jgi:hypothetical protein
MSPTNMVKAGECWSNNDYPGPALTPLRRSAGRISLTAAPTHGQNDPQDQRNVEHFGRPCRIVRPYRIERCLGMLEFLDGIVNVDRIKALRRY